VGVWEAVWSQAATEAAEGEGWWSGGGGAERAVAMRRRGVSAVMPVSAGSHSSKCASVRSVAVVCSDVAMSRVWMWMMGSALWWWRVVRRRSKLAGSFPGVQRSEAGSDSGPNTYRQRRVLRCLCGRLCHHAVNCRA
jgi:hypothetical protein